MIYKDFWIKKIDEHMDEIHTTILKTFKESMTEGPIKFANDYGVILDSSGDVRTALYSDSNSMAEDVFNGDAIEVYRTTEFNIFEDYNGSQEITEVREILDDANALESFIKYHERQSGVFSEASILGDLTYYLTYTKLKDFAEDTDSQQVKDAYKEACENIYDYYIQNEEESLHFKIENLKDSLRDNFNRL